MGRDPEDVVARALDKRFNPRARMGRDFLGSLVSLTYVVEVSIHAPVWGATREITRDISIYQFQSTRPYGARQHHRSRDSGLRLFQSTRPYGARLETGNGNPTRCGFNPRARMGRDEVGPDLGKGGVVSIHAPVWGATIRA